MHVGIGCAQIDGGRCLSRTDPKGRDGRLLDALFALLDLVAGLAHAGLLVLGKFGVATSLLEGLRLREGKVPPCVSPWTRGDRSPCWGTNCVCAADGFRGTRVKRILPASYDVPF